MAWWHISSEGSCQGAENCELTRKRQHTEHPSGSQESSVALTVEIWHPVCFRQDTVRDNPGNACSHQGSSPWVNPGDTTQVNGVSQDLGRQLSHRGFSTISDGKKLCEKGEAGRKTCTTAPSIKIQDITLSELFAPIRSAPLVDVWLWLNARLRMD